MSRPSAVVHVISPAEGTAPIPGHDASVLGGGGRVPTGLGATGALDELVELDELVGAVAASSSLDAAQDVSTNTATATIAVRRSGCVRIASSWQALLGISGIA